ncbi:MAG: hypothetical protein ACTTK5_00030 [Candidatus Fimenecus sp.]
MLEFSDGSFAESSLRSTFTDNVSKGVACVKGYEVSASEILW